jgi:uncharacterized repeat protein (TIGR01451 family)
MSALRGLRRGRSGRRLWAVGATLIAAAAFGVFFVAASGAAPSPCPIPGGFEIDGDMTHATCDPPGDDWDNAAGVVSTTQGGTYSTSNKDNSDPSNWTSSGATPNKTDFAQAYATSRVMNGHFYVYVAWERTDTTGTQGYAIEITNAGSSTAADGTPQPNRDAGGDVFYISSQGASAPEFNSACSYTSQSDYGTTCTSSDASFTGAINTTSMSDPLNNTTQPAGGFFEVALDVTGLTGITPSCPGAAANTVYLRSITGQTSNGNLKGYMAPLEVAPNSTCVPPPMTTTATPGGSTAAIGSAQHDTVSVGTAQAPGVGSVEFFLCSPAEVTANGGDCSANGTQVGSAVTLDSGGAGTSATINGGTTPNDNTPGKYCWRAEFTPSANDHNYLAGSHTNSTTECFTVVKNSPTIVTTPDPTSVTLPASGPLTDSAVLSGGFNPTGTITFTLVYNGSTVDTEMVTVSGNGTYSTPTGYTLPSSATVTGTYQWNASYSGDSNNNQTSETNDVSERVTVNPAAPDISTTPSETSGSVSDVLNDTAHLSGGSTFDGSGTITFRLFGPNDPNCDGTPAYAESVTADHNGDYHTSNASVLADTEGTWNWTAVFSGDTNNNQAVSGCGEEQVVISAADIHILKMADAAQVNAGDSIGFTLTVWNDGSGDAQGVTLSDLLPTNPGLNWVVADTGAGWGVPCTISLGVLSCGPVTVPAGTTQAASTFTVHITSTTDKTTGGACDQTGGLVDNTGSVSTTNDGNDSSEATICVAAPAIHIAKTADAATVNVGDDIGFTMTVWNDGNGDAKDVTLTDILPTDPGLSWSIDKTGAGFGSTCSIAAGVLTCGPVTVPAGTTQAASTFTVHITSATTGATGGDCPRTGVVDNTANVTTTNDGSDQSSASTCVQALVDLAVTKSGSPADQELGAGNITWTMVVTNNGPSAATGVVIADPMPAGNTFVSATTTKGTCTGGAVLHCTIGSMAVGESVTITLVTTPSTVGQQTNTVNVVGDRPETNTANNTATATVQTHQITPPPVKPCVAVSKVTPKQLFVGRKTTLKIHVTQGGKAVKGIHVRIKGAKINLRTKASNSKGLITKTITLKKAGVLVFTPIASKACNTKRVGVTNVFTPPVTG